jgi:hypothetical protein
VTDLVPPDDLVALKAAWYAADARAMQLATVEPEGDQTIARVPLPGRPDTPIRLFSEEQSAALDAARAERLELTLRLARHPWKAEQSDVHAAGKALNLAAFGLWTRTREDAPGPD